MTCRLAIGVLLLAVLIFAAGQRTWAYDMMYYCTEPSEPDCIDWDHNFKDQFAFDMCRSEVESYVSEVESYISCLNDEISNIQSHQQETQGKAGEVIEKFNCHARGESFCP